MRVRRLIAVAVGLGFLFLIVFGVKGCLNARKERGIENYTRDAAAIMDESSKVGETFFSDFGAPGNTGEVDLKNQILTLRGQSQSLLDRADDLSAPGDLDGAQQAILLSLKLRRDALGSIADSITAALADAERTDALDEITAKMGSLFASDVLYTEVAVPEFTSALDAAGIDGIELSPGNFMPLTGAATYLDSATISEKLGGASSAEVAPGLHGMGLLRVSLGGTVLSPDSTNSVASDSNEVEIQAQNQGESEETGVRVTVSFNGQEFDGTIETVAPGETATVNIPLTALPSPGTESTLEVTVDPVPGEQVSDNNQASYTVQLG